MDPPPTQNEETSCDIEHKVLVELSVTLTPLKPYSDQYANGYIFSSSKMNNRFGSTKIDYSRRKYSQHSCFMVYSCLENSRNFIILGHLYDEI